MELIAHRCGPGSFAENSLEAAAQALSDGADRLEIDVRWTLDGVPVVSHDPSLLRLFGQDRLVGDLTLGEVPQLLPLEAYLTSSLGPWLLDIKEGGGRLNPLLNLIESWGAREKVVLGVRSLDDLATVQARRGLWRTLGFLPKSEDWPAFVQGGVDVVRLWDAWFDSLLVARVQQRGVRVWVMTGAHRPGFPVGEFEPSRVPFYLDAGIDGVLVNRVAEFRDVSRNYL